MLGETKSKWCRLAAVLGVMALAGGASMVFAAEAGEAVNLLSVAQSSHIIQTRSVISESSFDLFRSTIDQINDPTRLADITRDEVTPTLGRPSSGGQGTPRILFTGLANRADVDTFQVGGIYARGNGNLAGYLAWEDWNRDNLFTSGSFSSGQQNDASATELMLAWGQRGQTYNWGVKGTYLDRKSRGSNFGGSSLFSSQFNTSYVGVSGAIQNHAREDFTWTVGGNFATGDFSSGTRSVDGSFDSRRVWDFDGTTWGGNVRLNWYQGGERPSALEVTGSYSSTTGDLNNPMVFMQSYTYEYEQNVTGDDLSSSSTQVGLRWQKEVGSGVDFAVGLAWENYDIDGDFAGDITDTSYTPSGIGRFRTWAKVEGDEQSIPTSVRARLGEKWTAVAGANFWRSDVTYRNRDMFAETPTFTSESGNRNEETYTGTDYALGLRYQHSDNLSAELGFRDASAFSSRHVIRSTDVTLMIGISF